MLFDWYEVLFIAFYFWVAGLNAEFMHNHTCNMFMSISMSLIWPLIDLLGLRPKDLHKVPKYYRDRM